MTWWLLGIAGIATASFMMTLKAETDLGASQACEPATVAEAGPEAVLEEAFAEAAADTINLEDHEHVHRGGGVAGNIHASVTGSLEIPGTLPTIDPSPAAKAELTRAS